MSAPASVVELKQRLHDKIAQLAARRLGSKASFVGPGSSETEGEKPKSRQEILEKRRAKKAERKKKNAAKGSQVKGRVGRRLDGRTLAKP